MNILLLKRSMPVKWIKTTNRKGETVEKIVEYPRYWCYKCGKPCAGMYSPCENSKCSEYNKSLKDLLDELKPNENINKGN